MSPTQSPQKPQGQLARCPIRLSDLAGVTPASAFPVPHFGVDLRSRTCSMRFLSRVLLPMCTFRRPPLLILLMGLHMRRQKYFISASALPYVSPVRDGGLQRPTLLATRRQLLTRYQPHSLDCHSICLPSENAKMTRGRIRSRADSSTACNYSLACSLANHRRGSTNRAEQPG